MNSETEKSEEMAQIDLLEGLERASEEVFYRYDTLQTEKSSIDCEDVHSSIHTEISELENALITIRILQELLKKEEISNELIQEVALSIPTETSTDNEIKKTAQNTLEFFSNE